MIGLDGQGFALRRLGRYGLVPPDVAARRPRNVGAGPPVHDHVPDRGRFGHRLVGGALHRDHVAAASEGVGRDQHLGVAPGETGGHRLGAIAREARRVDRADARHREHRHGRLLAHRQEDADGVARPDPEARERIGEAADLARQLRIGQRAHAAVLGLRDHRGLVAVPRGHVRVHALGRQIHAPAHEPARPLDAARGVHHLLVRRGPRPAEVANDGAPVPLEILDGAALKILEGGEAVRAHEARDPRAGSGLGIGPPDDLVRVHRRFRPPPGEVNSRVSTPRQG